MLSSKKTFFYKPIISLLFCAIGVSSCGNSLFPTDSKSPSNQKNDTEDKNGKYTIKVSISESSDGNVGECLPGEIQFSKISGTILSNPINAFQLFISPLKNDGNFFHIYSDSNCIQEIGPRDNLVTSKFSVMSTRNVLYEKINILAFPKLKTHGLDKTHYESSPFNIGSGGDQPGEKFYTLSIDLPDLKAGISYMTDQCYSGEVVLIDSTGEKQEQAFQEVQVWLNSGGVKVYSNSNCDGASLDSKIPLTSGKFYMKSNIALSSVVLKAIRVENDPLIHVNPFIYSTPTFSIQKTSP